MNPKQIDEYTVLEVLGTGAAGIAYRAQQPETQQHVAIKVLSSSQLSKVEELQKRFIREMSILQKLDHPNIVRYLGGGLHEDKFYYVMELVDCGAFKEVLAARGSLPWREAVECGIQICDALEHTHSRNVLHRDLKPANLFLSEENGLIKLGDFGTAHDFDARTITASGLTVGTCLYMSPEQNRGERNISHATDLYALGCVLFEMIAGQSPYRGERAIDVLDQHLNSPPPNAADWAPCPPRLASLIKDLLSKKPEQRPADAATVRAMLHDISAENTTAAATASPKASSPEQQNLVQRLRGDLPPQTTEVSWKALMAIAGTVLALIAAAAAANYLYSN